MDPCFSHNPQSFQSFQGSNVEQHGILPISQTAVVPHATGVLAYYAAVLRDKVQQLEPLVGMVVSPPNNLHDHGRYEAAAAMVAHSACSVLQEITAAANAVEQQLPFTGVTATVRNEQMFAAAHGGGTLPFSCQEPPAAQFSVGGASTSFGDPAASLQQPAGSGRTGTGGGDADAVVELDASYLLAKYTHYCQVCGKGFKRDANLRMHMRAHGDEYKTSASLSNPRQSSAAATAAARRSYSCPAEGCRWNRRHPRFQPLKSVVCAKNHYRRSHCPKVYACQRCDGKQFAVLSDLRTHEKHCGELRWRCSCGTFFSRKDKLMAHVVLFAAGHAPVPVAAAAAARKERS